MLRTLLQKLRNRDSESYAVDPACFDDPLALRVDWTAAESDGTRHLTRKLVAVDSTRMQFRATAENLTGPFIFLLAGIGTIVVFRRPTPSSGWLPSDLHGMIPLLVGLVLAVAGACGIRSGSSPIVFDKQEGCFWKGRQAPGGIPGEKAVGRQAALDSIHALQILAKRCRGSGDPPGDPSYDSYELNLILDTGRRIHVIGHGDRERMREDAGTLASFLKKPLWDSTLPLYPAPFQRDYLDQP